MSVPAWVYKRMAFGDISEQEVHELEKFAQSISPTGKAGARAVVQDPSNNLDDVLKNVDAKDRDDVLRALRQMKKQASGCASGHKKSSVKKRLKSMQKKAGNPYTPGQIGLLMGGAAMGPVLGHLAMRGIDRMTAKSPASAQRDLQRILEVHPDIGKPNDPRVQMAYASLLKLNPTYAEDPLIAGPLLKQIVESRMDPTNPMSAPYVDPNMAKNLSEARKSVREGDPRATLGDRFGSSISGAIGNIGSSGVDFG